MLRARETTSSRKSSAPSTKHGLEGSSEEDSGSDESLDDDDVEEVSSQTLETPPFIYECQRTLEEIQAILHKFQASKTSSAESSSQRTRFSLSALRCMEPKDLKWPLSRSKTMELVASLERHKSTCTIALAGDGLVDIHRLLMKITLSNKYLAEIRANQGTMLRIQLTQEQAFTYILQDKYCAQADTKDPEKALAWLSPVNPARKHQDFSQDRQSGTGMWLFDLPEMGHWLESSDEALWIYGIPGAGKTTLSTLVVDEILTRKRSALIGTAYFYIRHDNKDTHEPANVLGSLISQLASQNSDAMADIMDKYSQQYTRGLPALRDDELLDQVRNITQYFKETYIMIDGLDECGAVFDSTRKRLIDMVAGLHNGKGTNHILVFSRDERDIRDRFALVPFDTVSIAATSADIRLFAVAWLERLDIQSESLKTDVVDTLVGEAQGMFMWVRAQVDYLQRLPNDAEKRRALKMLPPDLPQTYIRIFETMESSYSTQTTAYIRRLLKWLVLGRLDKTLDLTLEMLRVAVCIEDQSNWPTIETMPTKRQILQWLGCLVREDEHVNKIHFSHFTIKEFLSLDVHEVSSAAAQQFLVGPTDNNYLLNVCLMCLTHDHFKDIVCTTWHGIGKFLAEYPFYQYMANSMVNYVMNDEDLDERSNQLLTELLVMPAQHHFMRWSTCYEYAERKDGFENGRTRGYFASPLHFVAFMGLSAQVSDMLTKSIDPDATEILQRPYITPLHLAITHGHCEKLEISRYGLCFTRYERRCQAERHETSLLVTKKLIEAGADVHRQLPVKGPGNIYYYRLITPLILALLMDACEIASALLGAGADCDATASTRFDVREGGERDVCSVKQLLRLQPGIDSTVQRTIELSGHDGLAQAFQDWKLSPQQADNPVDSFSDKSGDADTEASESNANSDDEAGAITLYDASWHEGDCLSHLLENGVHPDTPVYNGFTPLYIASANGHIENIRLLLDHGAKFRHESHIFWSPLLLAVNNGQHDALRVLLEAGADINDTVSDGATALHLAIRNRDTTAFSYLIDHGIDWSSRDNFGTRPLHEACQYGLDYEIGVLLRLATDPANFVNENNPALGTPLNIAASHGYAFIIEILLDHGAEIDKTAPGNFHGTALMSACAYGREGAVKVLLARGAALEVEASRFKSAEGTARAFMQERILRILRDYEAKAAARDERTTLSSEEGAESVDDVGESMNLDTKDLERDINETWDAEREDM
ncbi:MAG: hypothetical protein Q9210_001407 [Variospora velana]